MRVRAPDGKVIAFPDSMPPEQIKAVMQRYTASSSPEPSGRALAMPSIRAGMMAVNPYASVPPKQLSTIGAALGTPWGSAGASLGGASGEFGRQFLEGEPLSIRKAAWEGLAQAGLHAGGIGLEKGMVGGARFLAGPMAKAPGMGRLAARIIPGHREVVAAKQLVEYLGRHPTLAPPAKALLNTPGFRTFIRQSPRMAVAVARALQEGEPQQ